MNKLILLFSLSFFMSLNAQYQIDCQVTVDKNVTPYRSLISETASKTSFNMEGMQMELLNILDQGVYSLIPQQNMAIKMKKEMFDTMEVCNCTFAKTGIKKKLLGYDVEEYVQKCISPKGTSEVKSWYAESLNFNPLLIVPLRQYVSSSTLRPKGFPLFHEGSLSNGSKVKFEVISISKKETTPKDFSIPEGYMIMEY